MTRGRRSSLAALVMKAKLADKTKRTATCAVIFCDSFMGICESRDRKTKRKSPNFWLFIIVELRRIVKIKKSG